MCREKDRIKEENIGRKQGADGWRVIQKKIKWSTYLNDVIFQVRRLTNAH